jgi:DNA-binding NarL/FixJ family response regulator
MPAEVPGPVELRGLRVLVVEDEFLVAMDLELMLQELGCEVVGPIGDLARAQRTAAEETFDVALLDINIGGQPVTTVADALVARGVPMVFCTGYQAENLPDRYPAAPTLMKPFQATDIAAALRRAAAGASTG